MESKRDHLSLSKSGLMLSPCIAWAHPSSQWYDTAYDPESKRDLGTLVHSLIHTCLSEKDGERRVFGRAHAPTVAPMVRHAVDYCKERYAAALNLKSEVAVGIDWNADTAGVFDVKGRAYPDIPAYQFGTADIVCALDEDTLYVADWKTGEGTGWEDQVKSLLYATRCAMYTPDLIEHPPTRFIGACLRLQENGCWPEEKEYTLEQLQEHAFAMKERWNDAHSEASEPVPGIHCTQLYCPHLAYCRRITGEGLRMSETEAEFKNVERHHLLIIDPRTDTEAAQTMETVSAVKRQVNYITEKMKEYVKGGGKVVSGTWEWKDRGKLGYRWGKA